MQKITPFLWFDNNAEEAAEFYLTVFQNSKMLDKSFYREGSPVAAGSVMSLSIQLAGLELVLFNGGPYFSFTPALSLFVDCQTEEEIVAIWGKLTTGGMVLMELGEYPFSQKFGWVNDKFGVSWQVNLSGQKQKITPFLMYVGAQCGKAEEAVNFYASLFDNSAIHTISRYGAGEGEEEGEVKLASFSLEHQQFLALDSGAGHPFTFTEAFSLFVNCNTQEEVDRLWEKLTDGGEEGQCGWLKDEFGVSWQIVPTKLSELLSDPDTEKAGRVMEAMLKMKKLDINKLKEAYENK